MTPSLKIADSMLDLVGGIPLVRINRIAPQGGAEILVKPEFLNPSGSIKDRIARRMIEEAERQGILTAGSKIIEATGGNTGTALARRARLEHPPVSDALRSPPPCDLESTMMLTLDPDSLSQIAALVKERLQEEKAVLSLS